MLDRNLLQALSRECSGQVYFRVKTSSFQIVCNLGIEDIPKHYSAVSVEHSVIMPNHIHLLLQINTDSDGRSMIAPTLSTVVRLMKGMVTK